MKGVPGVGPATLQKQMSIFVKDDDDDEKRLDKLMGYMATITGKQREVIETYVKAIIYEPTNYATEMAGSVTRSYLGAEPTTLPSYLEEFSSMSTSMIVGPEVLECKGICNKRHKFLAAEGHK